MARLNMMNMVPFHPMYGRKLAISNLCKSVFVADEIAGKRKNKFGFIFKESLEQI